MMQVSRNKFLERKYSGCGKMLSLVEVCVEKESQWDGLPTPAQERIPGEERYQSGMNSTVLQTYPDMSISICSIFILCKIVFHS